MSRTSSGDKTELIKTFEGNGDCIFYRLSKESDSFVQRGMLLNLNVFESALFEETIHANLKIFWTTFFASCNRRHCTILFS